MHLDCGDTIGYAQTALSGQMDLSQWERFYLMGTNTNLGQKSEIGTSGHKDIISYLT